MRSLKSPAFRATLLGVFACLSSLSVQAAAPAPTKPVELQRYVGRWYDRVGPAKLLIPGVIIVSAVLWAMTLLGPNTWVGNILAGHVVMSIGFAFLFTPLFTVSLSSVNPKLYSHGSAILGSIQQVAGASGVALFVALMSARAATLSARGLSPIDALSGGVRSGFLCGALISLLAVVCVFFVQRPAGRPDMGH